MNLKRKIAESVLYVSLGNILIKLFSIVGYVLILRKLSLHDYGVFTLLVSFVGPAAAIAFFSFDRIFVSQFSKARGLQNIARMKGLFKEYYRLGTILIVLMFAIVYGFRLLFGNFYEAYIFQYMWPISLFIFSQLMMNMVSVFLESNEEFKKISTMEIFESFMRSILVMGAFLTLPFSVTLVLLVYTLAKFSAIALGILSFIKIERTLFKNDTEPERGVLWGIFKSFGKWEIGSNIFEKILQPVKLLLMRFFVGIEAVAVYDFAGNVYAFMYSLFPVKRIIFPIVSRFKNDREKINLIIAKAQKYSFLMYATLYVAVLLTTPFVLKIAFPQYAQYSFVIFLFALHFIVDIYKLGQSSLLYAYNQQKFMFTALPVFLVIQVTFDVLFIKLFGIIGSVLSWHLYSLCNGFIVNRHLAKKVKFHQTTIREFISFDEYDKVVLSGITSRIRSYLPKF